MLKQLGELLEPERQPAAKPQMGYQVYNYKFDKVLWKVQRLVFESQQ